MRSEVRKSKHFRNASFGRVSRLQAKPALSIIGTGRLGTALTRALGQHGYRIELVAAKHAASARRAAQMTGQDTIWMTSNQFRRLNAKQSERLRRSSVIVISTPDDVVANV